MRKCTNCTIKVGYGHIYKHSVNYEGHYVCCSCYQALKKEIRTGIKTSVNNLNHKLGLLKDTMSKAIEITNILTPLGIQRLEKGQILVFKQEDGSRTNLKITRIANMRVWGKEVKTYSPDEVAIIDKVKNA